MGNPSDSTINRWLKELKDLRLIRVLQKGRGLTNNYYFLRSPILGNMTESEFEEGPKSVYGGRLLDEATLVTGAEAFELFRIEAHEWLRKSRYVGQYSFPKWYGRKDRQLYKSVKQEFDMQLKEKILFSSLDTITTELEWNEHSALCSQEVGCE
jgi:hypothetical protein